MLNQSGISKVSGTTNKTILIAPELAFSMSCKVAATGVIAGDDGKKIVKAGTPLAGNYEGRDVAFTVAKDSTATCILLHDVDVTSGTANGTAVIFGFVDTSKLDSDVAAMLNSNVKDALNKITFVK